MHYLYSALKSYDTEALEKRRQYNELGRASKTHNDMSIVISIFDLLEVVPLGSPSAQQFHQI